MTLKQSLINILDELDDDLRMLDNDLVGLCLRASRRSWPDAFLKTT